FKDTAALLQQTLEEFSLPARVVGWLAGPTVTLFKVELPSGVKLSKLTGLADDIALALAASSVRIAQIPNTSLVGVEIPNKQRQDVLLGDIIPNCGDAPLDMAIGEDIDGNGVCVNLAKMPHLLIGGTTGSGKSVCLNSMIMSIITRATPAEVRMILIDPKRIEFSQYNGIPHLYVPVVTEPGEAASALTWGTVEMERRFKLIQKAGTRNISRYNKMVREGAIDDPSAEPLPYLVIVIDELADLMMQARKEVETSICRIAQLGRAAGIHLIIATQRPSTDIVTGLIKSNITNRMALKVASGIDSRVIIDQTGAQDLLGHGDMLLDLTDWPKARRLQGCFLTDKEIQDVCEHLRTQGTPDYHEDILKMSQGTGYASGGGGGGAAEDDDPLVWEAAEAVVAMGFGSTSGLQRRLKVGYSRAGRIMDMLEAKGIVGPQDGTKPREVLVDAMELESLKAFEQADADADWGGF
ncbi:MAG: DNA translocase FtsK, partial [Coriobacteriales bacterium]|nr:DNA translocase FtsK [Coriobacteriales bacterium]